MSSSMLKFDGPEFSRVFKQINKYQSFAGYYRLRALNKFYGAQFEEQITTAKVDIGDLPSLASSKFAKQIQFLNVKVPNELEDLSDLYFVSPTFLPNIKKVNIIFTEGNYAPKKITISQPLIFRGVNIIHNVTKSGEIEAHIEIFGNKKDIQIIQSDFEGIGLKISDAHDITVQNCTFRNVPERTNIIQPEFFPCTAGLYCYKTDNKIIIDNASFINCSTGLYINSCQNVQISEINVKKCECNGLFLDNLYPEINLRDAEIFDCQIGVYQSFSLCNIQNSTIETREIGIQLEMSDLNYRHVLIKQMDGVQGQFLNIQDIFSQVTEVL